MHFSIFFSGLDRHATFFRIVSSAVNILGGDAMQLEGNGSTWKAKCPLIAQYNESMDGEIAASNYMNFRFFLLYDEIHSMNLLYNEIYL